MTMHDYNVCFLFSNHRHLGNISYLLCGRDDQQLPDSWCKEGKKEIESFLKPAMKERQEKVITLKVCKNKINWEF